MKRLEEIRDYFEGKGIDAEIIKKYSGRSDYRKFNKDYERLILNMIDKRPCTIEDLEEVVDLNPRELGTYIEILIKEKSYRGGN